VISKTPDEAVAERVSAYASSMATPVHLAMIGVGQPDLTAAAEDLIRSLGRTVPAWPSWPAANRASWPTTSRATWPATSRATWPATNRVTRPGSLRGLFAGGTLCDEAMVIATERLGPIRSNIPLSPNLRTNPTDRTRGHVLIDFGDDELTAGRAHPMIDQTLRLERLAAEAVDPTTSVILMDVVLGYGAHPDPAAELAPVIAQISPDGPAVVIALIGAKSDPQDLHAQAETLRAAGADVYTSNAHAARFACELIRGAT
jgi:FdrA protein